MKNPERYLILPDLHIPYHDKRAFRLLLKSVIPAFSWKGVILLGDVFDNYGISKFRKDPRRMRGLLAELEEGFQFLAELEPHFTQRIFCMGNHEKRYPDFLKEKAPEFYEIAMSWWESKFSAWTVVPYMADIRIGKVFFTHDIGWSGVNAVRQSLVDYQDNIVIGHTHRLDYVVQGNARGVAHIGVSLGWLGDVNKVDYRHRQKCRRDFVLGFGTMIVGQTKITYITPHPIVKYTCEVEGRIFP